MAKELYKFVWTGTCFLCRAPVAPQHLGWFISLLMTLGGFLKKFSGCFPSG